MSGVIKPPFGARLKLDHPLARGLVGCWLFNEGSGDKAYDYSGQGNHGTLANMNDPPISISGWIAGPHGGALVFDGTNDYVTVPVSPLWDWSTHDFSVILWIFNLADKEVPTQGPVQIGKMLPTAGGEQWWSFGTLANGKPTLYYWDGRAVQRVTGTTVVPLNTVTHLALSIKANVATIYLNGILEASGVVDPPDTMSPTTPLIMGACKSVSYQGIIPEASIYNRALSAEEIAYLYAQPYCMFEEQSNHGFWYIPPPPPPEEEIIVLSTRLHPPKVFVPATYRRLTH